MVVTEHLFGDKSATSTGFLLPRFLGQAILASSACHGLPIPKEPSQIYTEATSLGLEKKSWSFAMVKHMGKLMLMLPSRGRKTYIPPTGRRGENHHFLIIKVMVVISRLRRNNPPQKKGGFGGMVRIRRFHSSIRGFAKDFFGNFKEHFLLIPKFNCLKLNKSLSRNSQKSISAFF